MDLRYSKKAPAACTLFALLGFPVFSAYASDVSPYLFGDWDGERTRLANEGIGFDFGYTGEAAHNVSGGKKQLTRYADQWAFGTRLDLDKLWGWKGSSFEVVITERNGRNLTADAGLGNYQQVQEVYGRGQTWHLTVFAFDQQFFDDKLEWRAGRLPVGSDFATFSCEFQNLTFCGSQPGNIVGDYWINWPVSQWATWLKWSTTDQTYVKLGAYQLNPRYVDDTWARANGWKLSFPGGTRGALVPLEFGWTPTLHGLPGSYRFGGWYNNVGGANLYYDVNREPMALTGEAPLQDRSRHGGYVTLQQQVTGTAGGSGLNLFFNATFADSRTSPVDRQIALGAIYSGPFQHANDRIGVAVGTTHGSDHLARYERLYNEVHPDSPIPVEDRGEFAVEVFYDWRPMPWLSLRPNVQYMVYPGGSTENSNTLVLGLKSSMAF